MGAVQKELQQLKDKTCTRYNSVSQSNRVQFFNIREETQLQVSDLMATLLITYDYGTVAIGFLVEAVDTSIRCHCKSSIHIPDLLAYIKEPVVRSVLLDVGLQPQESMVLDTAC